MNFSLISHFHECMDENRKTCAKTALQTFLHELDWKINYQSDKTTGFHGSAQNLGCQNFVSWNWLLGQTSNLMFMTNFMGYNLIDRPINTTCKILTPTMLGQHKNIAAEIQCSLVYKSISREIFEKAIFYCIVPMFENINSSIASVIFSSLRLK